jgi:thiol-disulfide isomerase/thioredoxin
MAPPVAADTTPAEQFAKLADEYDEIQQAFVTEQRADRTPDGARRADKKRRAAMQTWWSKSLALIRQHPAEPAALSVIEKHLRTSTADAAEITDILQIHHSADPRLSKMVSSFYQSNDPLCWKFAIHIADKHPDRTTRGRACYALGWIAKSQLIQIEMGPDSTLHLVSEDKRVLLRTHAETFLSRAAKEYAEVPMERGADMIGPQAAAALTGLANVSSLKVGKVAPDIQGVDLGGQKLSLKEFRGRVVLLVFWASWCGPCMAEVPHEREIVEKLTGRPFVLIGVNGDEEQLNARSAVERVGIPWRSFASDASGRRGGIPAAWNVYSWPTTFAIDYTGVIRHINLRGKKLDEPLEEMVKEAEMARKPHGR